MHNTEPRIPFRLFKAGIFHSFTVSRDYGRLQCNLRDKRRTELETHTKRQATQHGCLSILLDDGDKVMEIVYGEEKIFCTGPNRTAETEQKSHVSARQDKPNEPTREEDPFHLSSLSPHSPRFQQSAGATPL